MNFEWVNWENPVAFWWLALGSASVLNICVWIVTFIYSKDEKVNPILGERMARKTLVALCAAYVFGCAFRSFLPRADVQRICLFDTWFSSVLVGRFVATIAELSFIAQWAFLLNQISKVSGDSLVRKISHIIFPLICLAECFSWYAVITTHYLGNSCEESLWAIAYSLIFVALFKSWGQYRGAIKAIISFSLVGCVLYVLFMTTVDVPMYVTRLIEDTHSGKKILGLMEGFHDLNTRWVVTHNIQDWRQELPWMSLYFTVAVWGSLAMCYFPTGDSLRKYLKAN